MQTKLPLKLIKRFVFGAGKIKYCQKDPGYMAVPG